MIATIDRAAAPAGAHVVESAFPRPPSPAEVEQKLFTIRYRADKRPHLLIRNMALCQTCDRACLWFCPAAVYRWEDGQVKVAFENCLECGTCRFACAYDNIDWQHPTGGYGIAYKRG